MRCTSFRFVISCCLVSLSLFATGERVDGAEIDLSSTFTDGKALAHPGESAEYTVAYSNLSDAAPVGAYLNIDFPVGAFMYEPSIGIRMQDTLGNFGEVYISRSCENLLIQLQGPGDDEDRPIPLYLPPLTTGVMTFALTMPMQPVTSRVLRVQYPAASPRKLDFTIGVCDDCDDLSTCFGPRVSSIVPPIESEYVVVDDGSGSTASLGCVSIKNDVVGKIALVRRGECEFGLKAINAQIAGALACVIMNNNPDQDLTTFVMNGGEFGDLVNIPVALLSNADADPLESKINAGTTVSGLIGGVETEELEFTSVVFHSTEIDHDPDSSNNADIFVTRITLFADGFESGDTTAWSNSVP